MRPTGNNSAEADAINREVRIRNEGQREYRDQFTTVADAAFWQLFARMESHSGPKDRPDEDIGRVGPDCLRDGTGASHDCP